MQYSARDTVAVWGCGAVGIFAMISAYMMGAERVIAIDRFARNGKKNAKAEVINYEEISAGDAQGNDRWTWSRLLS